VKKKYIPLDDTHHIINEYFNSQCLKKGDELTSSKDREIAECLAILCRKQGDTMRAIDLYVKVLVELAKSQVVSALYVS
jgi:hypothetical protein